MKQVLITGGAGFIGCNTARYLTDRGFLVEAVDDLSLGRIDNLPGEVRLVRGDVAEPETWTRVSKPEYIVHLAGASSAPMFPGNLPACFHNNVIGFIRLLDYALQSECKRVIYASTSSVYGNIRPPLRENGDLDIPNFYAVSKYCMEQIARMYSLQYGLDVVGLRFMSIYGPREDHKGRYANLVSQFIWDVEAGRRPVVYGDGEQTRDFTSVHDIAQAIWRCIEYPNSLGSTVFNVGSGSCITVNHLVSTLRELMDHPIEPEHIPNPVKTGYVMTQLADISRIAAVLGYEPTVGLKSGIQDVLIHRSST